MEKKLYITQLNKENKFSFQSFLVSKPPEGENIIEATQEMVDGLLAHTLCWENGQLIPNVKSVAEIVQEENEARKQNIQLQIAELKQNLIDTDYKAIKFAEGEMTSEEYAPIRLQRAEWRKQINIFELQLL